jgi:hypothetical protein
MKTKDCSNSKESSNKKVEDYLKKINFDKRSEQGTLSNKELQNILCHNLRKYFEGELNQDFILDLGAAIYEECPEDDALLTATCMMTNLVSGKPKSKKEVEEVLCSALKILEKRNKTG